MQKSITIKKTVVNYKSDDSKAPNVMESEKTIAEGFESISEAKGFIFGMIHQKEEQTSNGMWDFDIQLPVLFPVDVEVYEVFINESLVSTFRFYQE